MACITGENLKNNGRNTTAVTGGNLSSMDTCRRIDLNIQSIFCLTHYLNTQAMYVLDLFGTILFMAS